MRLFTIITLIFCVSAVVIWQSGFIKVTGPESDEFSEEEELIKIGSLAYANWVPVGKSGNKRGLVYHAEGQAFDAPAFYAPANMSTAFLVDNNGRELHSWAPKFGQNPVFQKVLLLPDGNLMVVAKDQYIARLDWNSKVAWRIDGRYHHDVFQNRDGSFYTLKRIGRRDEYAGKTIAVLDDVVEHISADGKILASYSVYAAVKSKIPEQLFQQLLQATQDKKIKNLPKNFRWPEDLEEDFNWPRLGEDSKFDILHTNSVVESDREIQGVTKPGDILVSVRNIDLIAVIDPKTGELRWSWGQNELDRQHHATFVEQDHILIFDNQPDARRSRVLEIDPRTEKIVWEYSPPKFFSFSRGSAQRLPNGNTFITESDRGRVREVNKSGQIVWEYYNPHIRQRDGKADRRAAIYRMLKMPGFKPPV